MLKFLDEAYEYWRIWFGEPIEFKKKYLRSPGKGGWYPPYSESPGYQNKDPKEYFHFRTNHFNMSAATEQLFLEGYNKALDKLQELGLDDVPKDLNNCVLRILKYFPTPDGLVGEAHKDFDMVTHAFEGTSPGLQVLEGGGKWVEQETGTHIGEMVEIYANYPATIHRVVTKPNVERFKAVFFFLPPNDFELSPGFTAADYLKRVLNKAGTDKVGIK